MLKSAIHHKTPETLTDTVLGIERTVVPKSEWELKKVVRFLARECQWPGSIFSGACVPLSFLLSPSMIFVALRRLVLVRISSCSYSTGYKHFKGVHGTPCILPFVRYAGSRVGMKGDGRLCPPTFHALVYSFKLGSLRTLQISYPRIFGPHIELQISMLDSSQFGHLLGGCQVIPHGQHLSLGVFPRPSHIAFANHAIHSASIPSV